MTVTSFQPLVSIIVPIYGVEDWLAACLSSVEAQTYPHWEAVLVVDGSPDGSEAIARGFAERDPRFVVHVTENGGLGAARNFGLDQARGEYVYFLDSDDTITPPTLELLVGALSGTDSEIAAGLAVDTYPRGRRSRYWTHRCRQFEGPVATHTLTEMPSLLDDHTAWAKLIHRDLIDRVGMRFPVGVHCEDIALSLRLQLDATSTSVVPVETYEHRRHEQTISADYLRARTLGDWLQEAARTVDIVVEHGDDALVRHYVGKHTLRQWWTRAERVTDFADDDLLERMETLSAAMLAALGDRPDGLLPLQAAALRFFADRGVSRRWSSLVATGGAAGDGADAVSPLLRPPSGSNPRNPARVRAIAKAALDAVALLDLEADVEAVLAAELLVSRVLVPLAALPGEGTAAALLDRARVLADALPREAYARVVRAPLAGDLPGDAVAAGFRTVLADLPLPGARVRHVRSGARGTTLRGDLATGGADLSDARFVARVRSADGTHRTVATWAAPDAHRDDRLRWQVVVPASSTPVEVDLEIERPYFGRVALPLHADADVATPDDVEVLGRRPLRLVGRDRPEARSDEPATPAGRVYTFPNWYSNPYMTMLHLEARACGYDLPGTVLHHPLVKELNDERAGGVVHLHWPSPVTEQAKDAADAERRVDELLSALEGARRRGRGVIWTVHNALPHDARFPAAAIRLHQGLADAADLVHLLTDMTLPIIGDAYRVDPAKTRLLVHSSYIGVYGAAVDPAVARAEIGADPDSRAVLFFGQLRPYKGLERLFAAATGLQDTNPVELLLAGKPAPALAPVLREVEEGPVRVTSALRFIEDAEVATWFSAADVAVLPYQKVLNSGAAHLAATYGVPVVLPSEPALVEDLGQEPWVRFFDPDDAVATITALLEDDWFRSEEAVAGARAFARRRSPEVMARGFLDLVEEADALGRARLG
ncbi:glycosyltransferase [Nocardioides zeae]|uniref:Glycosyltransferase n=1 Tax=Nocardioides imazamoxiresistens TaxID=3231893 RepID=A0ABU3PW92_9ACTN|nr:glycosyltransferase [Nocardioides zeae]MDT9593461.1 glycosyltransferase [Nocardioides zeae]